MVEHDIIVNFSRVYLVLVVLSGTPPGLDSVALFSAFGGKI